MIAVVFTGAILAIAGLIALLVHLARKKLPIPASVGGPPAADVDRAVAIVCKVYDMDLKTVEHLTWVTGSQLNCFNNTGWLVNGVCVAGMSWQDLDASAIAWPSGIKISDSALAHEMWHAKTWQTGELDPTHTGPGFAPGGPVDQANVALRKAGL